MIVHLLLNLNLYILTSISFFSYPHDPGTSILRSAPSLQSLDSPFFLKRREARAFVKRRGLESLPDLVENFMQAGARGKRERLDLLHPVAFDPGYNPLAQACLSARDPGLHLAAIRYLAGHPDPAESAFLEWSRSILEHGTARERRAYLAGIRRPAPPEQTRLLLDSMESLPLPLQRLALRALPHGWRVPATQALVEMIRRIREGRLGPGLLLPALAALGDRATEEASAAVRCGLTHASADVRDQAARAARAAMQHLFRARNLEGLITFHRDLARALPLDEAYSIQYVDALILYGKGKENRAARTLLDRIRTLHGAGLDAEDRVRLDQAAMGAALLAFKEGRTEERERDRPLPPVPGEEPRLPEPLREMKARRDLLAGALAVLQGKEGRSFFLSALEEAPYDADTPVVDRLFSGPFSLAGLLWILEQRGRDEEACRLLDRLVDALREDRSCAYYPRPGTPAYSDRARSRIPLYAAWERLHRLGDAKGCLDRLKPFVEGLKDSALPANLELLGTAFYYQSFALTDLGRIDEALLAAEKGARIFRELAETAAKEWPSAAMTALERRFRGEAARGWIQQESLVTLGGGRPAKSEALAWRIVREAPDFEDGIVTLALVLARRGKTCLARRVVEHLYPYPDRFYNLACLHALLDDREAALQALARHLHGYVPPHRRALAAAYAAADPDLASLRSEPAFQRLIR